ncbi:DUF932 domain-containing protein, partial [Candidatus Woesearchaeota archaeon]
MVRMGDREIPTGDFAAIRTDNNRVLATGLSNQYALVQNSDLVNAVRDVFDSHDMGDYRQETFVTNGGSYVNVRFDFGEQKDFKLAKVGDELGMRLVLKNSFDGSVAAGFALGFLRKVCSNGMIALSKEFSFSRRHKGENLSLDGIAEALQKAVAGFRDEAAKFDLLASVPVSEQQGNNILSNLAATPLLSSRVARQIADVWNNRPEYDATPNLYNVYNAVTAFSTHVLERNSYNSAQNLTKGALKALYEAAIDEKRLRKLIAPPKFKRAVEAVSASELVRRG